MSAPISILLVEDSPIDADLTLERLVGSDIAFRVTRVETRKDFLESIRNDPPDIILSDYSLPDFSGREALEIASSECPKTPFLFVSGAIGEEFAIESLKQGATDYVLKQRLDRLVPAVKRALSEARERAQRQQAEDALRESEARFRSLLEATTSIIWTSDPERRYIEPQPSWEAYTGQSWEQHRDFGWMNAVHPDDRDRVRGTWRKAQETTAVYDAVVRLWQAESGTYRYFVERAAPIRSSGDEVRAWIGTCTDIHDKMTAEQALRESEQRFRNLADNAPVMVWVTEPDGSCSYLSRSWYEFTGQTPEEAIGFGWLEAVHPGDRHETGRIFAAAVADRKSFRLEYRLRRHDGQWRWAIDAAAPRLGAGGEYLGHVGSVIDITERKRTEESLQNKNSELQQFAFAAAHDLQEPLRTVQTFTQLIGKRLDGKLGDEERLFMRYILDSSRRMADLIKDLRQYLDVAGRADEESAGELVHLDSALQRALENLQVAIRESGANITRSDLPVVKGNEVYFVQLLQNLLSNAIKYRRDGVPPRVHVMSERIDGEWIVSVHDNGIGISPAHQERVFGLFKRLHGKDVPGTGIGLAICQKVTERYGGRIWVDSEPGEGSIFRFTVPAA